MKRPYLITDPKNITAGKCWWPCTLCYPTMLQIGAAAQYCIVYNKNPTSNGYGTNSGNEAYGTEGKYAVLGGQGHGDDEDFLFLKKPLLTKQEFDKLYGDTSEYFNMVEKQLLVYRDVKYSIDNYGYNPDKNAYYEFWFLWRVSNLIRAWEKKFGMSVEQYYDKVFYPKALKAWHKNRDESNKRMAAEKANTTA